jgi:predicted  nucleic acid-binding Zn-ribbon protein
MKTIASLESKLSVLREQLKRTTDPDEAAELGEKIDFMQDEVDELEEAEMEQASYEEMTGTTPQDLYNERNSYAIAQGEVIDRFRNEY